jgi:hypothetical protein
MAESLEIRALRAVLLIMFLATGNELQVSE